MTDIRPRCPFVTRDPDYLRYHDEEWGVPEHDDQRLFEALVLEGAQAGLNWLTILKRRPAYRLSFDDFAPERVAHYDPARIDALLQNPALIRNRRKMESAVQNARAFLAVQEAFGSFDTYLWRFVDGRPLIGEWSEATPIPVHTPLAHTISHDLRTRGFGFVGPTIVYAYLQATGVVMDHFVACYRFSELATLTN